MPPNGSATQFVNVDQLWFANDHGWELFQASAYLRSRVSCDLSKWATTMPKLLTRLDEGWGLRLVGTTCDFLPVDTGNCNSRVGANLSF